MEFGVNSLILIACILSIAMNIIGIICFSYIINRKKEEKKPDTEQLNLIKGINIMMQDLCKVTIPDRQKEKDEETIKRLEKELEVRKSQLNK